MPVTLTVKNVPDATADALKRRAKLNHRSLQGELMAIMEAAAYQWQPMSYDELAAVAAEARRLGDSQSNDSTEIIRAARDGDYGR